MVKIDGRDHRDEGRRRPRGRRLLVAWFRYTCNGGIGRFANVARILRGFGHELVFTSLTDELAPDWPDFPGPVQPFASVREQDWDAVMVPGAGAADAQLALLARLREPRFGVRVQHVLNDPSRLDRFLAANASLQPHVVIFNNSHWRTADYRRLAGEAFHVLPGAVDPELFHPAPLKTFPARPPVLRLGGYAAKNPEPLLDALGELPPDCELHLYGALPGAARSQAAELAAGGRLQLHGPLFGPALADFYRDLDLVVTSETRAGWCNTAAEAMACGLPCMVSRAGTVDFARDGVNALVLPEVTGKAIAAAVGRLRDEPDLAHVLATNAVRTMRRFGWTAYCQQLLRCVEPPARKSYYHLPELGLHGKWDPRVRAGGLEPLLERCRNAAVLDLGAAEGIVGYAFGRRGARTLHGFEREPDRVRFAEQLFRRAGLAGATFRTADLADWPRFASDHADLLLDAYDIVLFLGLYHHLPAARRAESLRGALGRAREWFAIRTPQQLKEQDDLPALIGGEGFALVGQQAGAPAENLGWFGLFRRKAPA